MTKTLKKSFIVILMLVTSLFFGFAFGTANSASAADLTVEENKFISDVNAFIDLADTDDNGVLSSDEILAKKGNAEADSKFLSMYTFISNSDTGNTEATYVVAKQSYQTIYNQYNISGAVDFYSTLATSIRNIYTVTGSSYQQHTVVENARTEANKFADVGYEKDLAFLKNSDLPFTDSDDYEDLVKAEAKIAVWKANIENAIAAIKAIQVYVVKDPVVDTLTPVYDALTDVYLVDYVVLYGSKNSVSAARAAANIVINQNDSMYINNAETSIDSINHYSILTAAETAIAALENSVKNVKDLIDAAKAQYKTEAGSEVCYTIYESSIKPAKVAYAALTGADYNGNGVSDNLNNLQAGVTNINDLNAMLSTYATVSVAIEEVVTKITAIGTVKYDNDSKDKIKTARDAFDALPNDVKVNDNAENVTTYCVSNYVTLKAAEAKWNAYVTEVNDLIASIKKLRTVETTDGGINIFKEFGKTQDLYNNLSDKNNQLKGDEANGIVGVEPALLDEAFKPEGYIENITNCKDAYLYYQNLSNKINTATKDIIKDINTLNGYYSGLVRFNNAFDTTYTNIVNAIALLPKVEGELDPRYKGAINNYDTFKTLDDAYSNLLALAETWIDSIVNTVSVNTFDAVETSVNNFNAIVAAYKQKTDVDPVLYTEADLTADLAAFSRVYLTKLYSEYYTAYTASVAKKTEIIGKLDEIKDAVAEGTLVRPTLENALDASNGNAAYKTAVEDVTTKYNALSSYDDTSVEGYITTAKYFETGTNYFASYALYKAALINVKAHVIEEAIAKIASNADDNVDYISAARTAFDAAVAEGSVFTKDDVQAAVRNSAELTNAETAVKNFVDGVNELLNGADYNGNDVTAVDTAAINDDTLILGIYKLNVTNAKSLKNSYTNFSSVYKAYAAEGFVVADANTLLDSIIARVGDKTQGKIKYIDDQLTDFINQYTAGTSAAGRYEKLNEFVNALTSSQKALLDHLGNFEQIQRDKVVAEQLGEAIEKLLGEVNANKITNETVIDYYVINSIFENMNPSQKALVPNIGDKTAAKNLEAIKIKIDAAVAATNGVVDISSKLTELETAKGTLEDRIDGIDDAISDLQQIRDDIDALETLTGTSGSIQQAIKALQTAKGNIESQIADINTTLGNLGTKDTELAGLIEAITKENGTIDSKIADAKALIEGAYAAADTEIKNALDKAKVDLNTAINAEKTAREAAIKTLQEALTAAQGDIDNLKGDLATANTNITNLQKALEQAQKDFDDAMKAEQAAREEAIEAEQEARAEETKSLNNAIVTITIIFSIVLVALVACVVVLFLKARKA